MGIKLKGKNDMERVHIAFDIDGTLRKNTEKRHHTEVEPNQRQIDMLIALAHSKNTTIHLWSNRGAEYCRKMRIELGLEDYVTEKNCHLKQWKVTQLVEVKSDIGVHRAMLADAFEPNIAFDDQQRFDGGKLNIIVREK